MYIAALLIAAIGSVVYHLSVKQVPADSNPFLALAISYGFALIACIGGMVLFPAGNRSLAALNWSSAGVALGIVGIEVGFVLAYRSGWHVGQAALSTNVLSTLLLAPLGYWLFREQPSGSKLLGMSLSFAGLWLMMKK
ncbi:EamA family transporter [Parachitinimonas caeni]|uniref:EamA family transporter n=1 Tax=Parachitinimonas caeni TaxID=3031301 RepID=A0ABT7E211_9NEIS|nr:EamA family transporter [Parachitinimonas caeni]MDK2125378.1 EamA family transporter [Parachitinimonas caeni]